MFSYIDPTIRRRLVEQGKLVRVDARGNAARRRTGVQRRERRSAGATDGQESECRGQDAERETPSTVLNVPIPLPLSIGGQQYLSLVCLRATNGTAGSERARRFAARPRRTAPVLGAREPHVGQQRARARRLQSTCQSAGARSLVLSHRRCIRLETLRVRSATGSRLRAHSRKKARARSST